MHLRPTLLLGCALLLAAASAVCGAEASGSATALAAYGRAETQPAETTIFLFNKILLTTQGFERKGATYETNYSAKVSPFKSLSENGRLTIDVSDDQLRQLERGEAVDFTGRAVSKGGGRHSVSGTAIPADKTTGKLKVHIDASVVTLRFETTYRFTSAGAPHAAGAGADARAESPATAPASAAGAEPAGPAAP